MELPYLFGVSLFGNFKLEEEDREIADRFGSYLCSFVETG
jgi:hypothetical protein